MSAEPVVPLRPTISLEPAYLTPDQVGELLQVKVKTVYSWATDDSTMPRIKIGGTVRFPRERLLRWLQAREQGAPRKRARKGNIAKGLRDHNAPSLGPA